ncbi:MAG: hypothetical protein GY797_24305 [Deltaproteobacteria bacterium]|nr:hypothetical protein [Deltaproteobacteria bacterium]
MVTFLQEAFEMASKLPQEEQSALAALWIEEMKEEMKWEKTFADSQDVLEALADKALEEIAQGKAEEIGWNELVKKFKK